MPASGLEPDLTSWLALTGLAGLFSLDQVSWPQGLLSRPLVASTAGAAVLGEPAAGVLVGAVLELIALRHLPLGGAQYPETGAAGVVAGAAYAAGGGGLAPLLVAAVAGWALGWLGSWSMTLLRRLGARVFREEARDGISQEPGRLERRHRAGVALDFARGAVLGGAFLVPVTLLVRLGAVEAAGAGARAALVVAAGAAGGAGARELGSGSASGWTLAAGMAAGVAAGWLAA